MLGMIFLSMHPPLMRSYQEEEDVSEHSSGHV